MATRVSVNGRLGTLVGRTAGVIRVLFDGETVPTSCDPSWRVEYH
jgi:hypothetical protein